MGVGKYFEKLIPPAPKTKNSMTNRGCEAKQ